MPTLYYSTKACGYHPCPSFTFYLEGLWSPYYVSKCYECFNAFSFSCMQLDHNTYEGLIGELRLSFIGS